jgi:hypothetical protein
MIFSKTNKKLLVNYNITQKQIFDYMEEQYDLLFDLKQYQIILGGKSSLIENIQRQHFIRSQYFVHPSVVLNNVGLFCVSRGYLLKEEKLNQNLILYAELKVNFQNF